MANNPHFWLTTRHTALDTVSTDLGSSAVFVLYAGVQPADVSAATTGANVAVASLSFTESSAFAAATASAATANSITDDTSAVGGTTAWFSMQKATGQRVVDGECGTSGADLNLNALAITTGAAVSVTAFTVTFAA